MQTESELFDAFRDRAFVTSGAGIPYFEVAHALAFVDACDRNDLAVIGLDGYIADRSARRLVPRNDIIVDTSRLEAPGWAAFLERANAIVRDVLRQHVAVPDLVSEFVLWSAAEHRQGPPGGGIEIDVGAADGGKLRLSNKMIKLLPRRGWTIEKLVEAYRNPERTGRTIDQSIRPR